MSVQSSLVTDREGKHLCMNYIIISGLITTYGKNAMMFHYYNACQNDLINAVVSIPFTAVHFTLKQLKFFSQNV